MSHCLPKARAHDLNYACVQWEVPDMQRRGDRGCQREAGGLVDLVILKHIAFAFLRGLFRILCECPPAPDAIQEIETKNQVL